MGMPLSFTQLLQFRIRQKMEAKMSPDTADRLASIVAAGPNLRAIPPAVADNMQAAYRVLVIEPENGPSSDHQLRNVKLMVADSHARYWAKHSRTWALGVRATSREIRAQIEPVDIPRR